MATLTREERVAIYYAAWDTGWGDWRLEQGIRAIRAEHAFSPAAHQAVMPSCRIRTPSRA